MAIGSYGTIRPSDVSPEDVEILMVYTPSRDVTDDFTLTKLNAPTILRPYFNNTQTGGNAGVEVLGGLYNLSLPAQQFNALGIYTLYLRPAQIRTVITDCGVLSALPTVKGIVVDLNNVPSEYQNKFQKAIRYRYVDGTSNLLFLTLSPSSSPTNNPNATPYIGQPTQGIIVSNTYFNPVTIEIEMVEYDISSLGIALYGNQTKSIDDGIYTI